MPTDPQEGIDDWFVPADPSQWQSRGLPQIIVRPKPPLTGPSENPAGADGIDDWFVPGQSPSGADGPDDWYVPAPLAIPPAPTAQDGTANPGVRNPASTRPDPFEAYWSLIPASRIGAMAWHPPIFPNSAGQFPLPAPASLSVPGVAKQGLLGALADLPATNGANSYGLLGALANLPATDAPSYGLLGAIANLPSANPTPSPSSQPTGLPALDLSGEPPGPDPAVASGSGADLLASPPTPEMDNARFVKSADQPTTNGLPSAGPAVAVAPPIDQTSVGNEGSSQAPTRDRQLDTIDQSGQESNLETGLSQSQIQALAELYRDALASVGSFVRANDQLARLPIDLADMVHDAATDFPEFLRRAEPGLTGLGLSIPMSRAAGNVWLLNDTLRGRMAEIVHGRNLPFTFKTIDRFLDGIVTSIKSIDLNARSYQNVQKLYSTLRGQIDKVADFIEGSRSGVVIKPHEIKGRALDVLVPHMGNAAQKLAIKRAVDYGALQGVTVNIIRHQ